MDINMTNTRNHHLDYNSDLLENLCFDTKQALLVTKFLALQLRLQMESYVGFTKITDLASSIIMNIYLLMDINM